MPLCYIINNVGNYEKSMSHLKDYAGNCPVAAHASGLTEYCEGHKNQSVTRWQHLISVYCWSVQVYAIMLRSVFYYSMSCPRIAFNSRLLLLLEKEEEESA
jgi:hypothetical protein